MVKIFKKNSEMNPKYSVKYHVEITSLMRKYWSPILSTVTDHLWFKKSLVALEKTQKVSSPFPPSYSWFFQLLLISINLRLKAVTRRTKVIKF